VAARIRLARGGKRHRPYYRIVVADGRASRDGKFIERIGSYDPLLAENKVTLNVERARHWLDCGARPSERVSKLLALQGVEHALVLVPKPAADAPAAKPKAKAKGAKSDAAPAGEAAGGKAKEGGADAGEQAS
jgi:small subunit ribosomal protein S16